MLRELSLFTGGGGGIYGTKLLNFRTVGYVEIEEYCQKVIRQRIKDGIFDEAPIFSDVKTFISEGFAGAYTSMVDVITAGFPCQPFSVAGKREGEMDERNLWPATLEIIRIVRPRRVLLENVPGLFASGYFGTILGDLERCGYDAKWCCISASECGAWHKRKRLWIMAKISDPKIDFTGQLSVRKKTTKSGSTRCNWWSSEPNVGRVAHGVADGKHRLKALGNGQVPIVVATAWRMLNA